MPIGVALTGLTPSTYYHYQAVASNLFGITRGGDCLFVTWRSLAPEVYTFAPTNVTSISAALNAWVTPHFLPTAIWFEWGTTTNYGSRADYTNDLRDSGPGWIIVDISGLTPSTTYHCQVVASNLYGITRGEDRMCDTEASGDSPLQFTRIRRQGTAVVVEWIGGGMLQKADSLPGLWLDLDGALSPYTNTPPSGPGTLFFRAKR